MITSDAMHDVVDIRQVACHCTDRLRQQNIPNHSGGRGWGGGGAAPDIAGRLQIWGFGGRSYGTFGRS